MATAPVPPTYAPPFIRKPGARDDTEVAINPIWLSWFLSVAQTFTAAGATESGLPHNGLTGLQGGTVDEYYHLTAAQRTALISLLAASAYALVEDEGVALPARTTINFTGAGVTATDVAGKTVVNIPGGGGGGLTWTSTTVDFGAAYTDSGSFAVTDAGISATSTILVEVSGADSTADNSTAAHAMAAAFFLFSVTPAAGSMQLDINVFFGLVSGEFVVRYAIT